MKTLSLPKSITSAMIGLVAISSSVFAEDQNLDRSVESSRNSDAYVLEDVLPSYPDSMREMGRQGRVLIQVRVSETGDISGMQVVAASQPEFGTAALKAIGEWMFEPGMRNGVTVPQTVMVPVDFLMVEPEELRSGR